MTHSPDLGPGVPPVLRLHTFLVPAVPAPAAKWWWWWCWPAKLLPSVQPPSSSVWACSTRSYPASSAYHSSQRRPTYFSHSLLVCRDPRPDRPSLHSLHLTRLLPNHLSGLAYSTGIRGFDSRTGTSGLLITAHCGEQLISEKPSHV